MSEILVLRLLESLIPLLLFIIILMAVIYFIVQKVINPFNKAGSFLYEKFKNLENYFEIKRRNALLAELNDKSQESSQWKDKYVSSIKSVSEIKDKLDDLAKVFKDLDEIELLKALAEEHRDANIKQIENLKVNKPENIFRKIATGIKINKISRAGTANGKKIMEYETIIINKKELFKAKMEEILDSVNNLPIG